MKKFILVILFLSSNLFSQTAFEFLKLDASARSAAVGGAFVSNVDDPNSIFYNPASLRFVDPNNVSFGFLKHLLDVNSGFASYTTQSEGFGKIGFGAMYTNYGSFDKLDEFGNSSGTFSASDLGLIANYSGLVREYLSYGVNVKFIYSSIYNVSAVALAGDFGLLYYNEQKKFSAGVSVLNVGSQLKAYYNSKEQLPVDVRLGLSKKLEHTPFRLYLEFTKLNQTEKGIFSGFNNFILGGEIYTSSALTFRFGFNNEKRKELKVGTTIGTEGFNLGIGINLSGYRFDYAISSLGKIGTLHRINISTNF
ncbi:MAG: type IX secretion system protein PorQ [Ignavibacteria bacterium]